MDKFYAAFQRTLEQRGTGRAPALAPGRASETVPPAAPLPQAPPPVLQAPPPTPTPSVPSPPARPSGASGYQL